MKYFIANWKARKNLADGLEWLYRFQEKLQNDETVKHKLFDHKISIIICPPYPLLYPLKEHLSDIPNYALGSQDISSFPEGSYTGEVTSETLTGCATYAIIGHSERRKHFHETDKHIAEKVKRAKLNGIEPILCIRNEKDRIPEDARIVAYEPVEAIGTGRNALVAEVVELKDRLHLTKHVHLLYGGSVDPKNAGQYIKSQEIDGMLIGTASLDPHTFFSIVSLHT